MYVEGELGAGKTAFVRGAARALGVAGAVTSPTFTVAHLYDGAEGPVAHLDLSRSERVDEAAWGDLEPYFDDVRAVFVEWASVGAGVLPPPHAVVRIAVRDDGTRQIDVGRLSSLGAWPRGRCEPVTLVLDSATARSGLRASCATGSELAFASAEGGHAAQRALVLVDEVLARAGREARRRRADRRRLRPRVVHRPAHRHRDARAASRSALGVPCVGVSTLAALAAGAPGAVALIDARRGELFALGRRRRARRRAAGGRGRAARARHAVRG